MCKVVAENCEETEVDANNVEQFMRRSLSKQNNPV